MREERICRYLSFSISSPTECATDFKKKAFKKRPKISMLTPNSIVIPEDIVEMPQYSSIQVDWEGMRKSSGKPWKEYRNNIMQTSFAFNMQYPGKEEEEIRMFENIVEKKLQLFNSSRYKSTYSIKEKFAIEDFGIDIYSEEFQFVSKLQDDNEYNFFDRLVLYFKIINKSNFLDYTQYENITNILKDWKLPYPDYSKSHSINTYPLVSCIDFFSFINLNKSTTVVADSNNSTSVATNLNQSTAVVPYIEPKPISGDYVFFKPNPEIIYKTINSEGCNTMPISENTISVVCQDMNRLNDLTEKIKKLLYKESSINNSAKLFAITFVNTLLSEVMEEGIEKNIISYSLFFFVHYNYLSWINTGNYALHNIIANITEAAISKIIKVNKTNSKIANALIYSTGNALKNGDLFDVEDHISGMTSYSVSLLASDFGAKTGKYICKKMGGKIPSAYSENISEMKMIDNIISYIKPASSCNEFKAFVEVATTHIEQEGKLSGKFISALKKLNPLYDRDSFYDLLQQSLDCNKTNWTDFKNEITTFGFRTKNQTIQNNNTNHL